MSAELPRFRLAALPTPLGPALRLHDVWVKRDDLTGFATAGNKARPLEFLIGDALAQHADVLVTGGGAGSNYCAAAAAAARVAGLDCHLVLYGSPPRPGESINPNLAAALEAGARVHFTGWPDREELDRAITDHAASLALDGLRPYSTPRGGATPIGAVGYARALDELADQLDGAGVEPGIIVVPTGSGGTQAGLVAGLASGAAPGWRIVGATVSRPPAEIRETVWKLAGACAPLLDRSETGPPAGCAEMVEIVDARGPGFGLPSEEGQRAGLVARATEGLLLDPVYTAKAFAVVLRLVAVGFDRPIVFWHTGGLPAALHHLSNEALSTDGNLLCPT